jgi:hypothetical protein
MFSIRKLDLYLEAIRADYAAFKVSSKYCDIPRCEQMVEEFNRTLTYEIGSRYVKVVKYAGTPNASVHSFICMTDMGKFCKGDILKAASWKAPARNHARGNVVLRQYPTVQWTGIH